MRRLSLRGIIVIAGTLGVLSLWGAFKLIENNFDEKLICTVPETKITETSGSEIYSGSETDNEVFTDIQVRKKYVTYSQLNVHTSPILEQDIGYDNVVAVLKKSETVYTLDDVSFSDPRTNRLWYYITTDDKSVKGWVVSDGLS